MTVVRLLLAFVDIIAHNAFFFETRLTCTLQSDMLNVLVTEMKPRNFQEYFGIHYLHDIYERLSLCQI